MKKWGTLREVYGMIVASMAFLKVELLSLADGEYYEILIEHIQSNRSAVGLTILKSRNYNSQGEANLT